MTTTKKDIVRDVAMKTGFDIVTVKDMVQAMFDAMCEGLAEDKNIEIRNFGIFKVKYTPERKARNPKTSEIITVPAKRHINFKPGQLMKEKINEEVPSPITGSPFSEVGPSGSVEQDETSEPPPEASPGEGTQTGFGQPPSEPPRSETF